MFHSSSSKTVAKFISNNSTKALGSAFVASYASATYYRPTLDRSGSDTTTDNGTTSTSTRSTNAASRAMNTTSSHDNDDVCNKHQQLLQKIRGPNRNEEYFASKESPSFFSDRNNTPFWLNVAQHITISITTIAIRIFMNTYGEYDIVNDEHYHHFLSLVVERHISKDISNIIVNDRNSSNINSSSSSSNSSRTGGKEINNYKQGILTVSNHRSLFDDPGVVSCLLPLHLGIQPKYNRWGICSQEYCFNDKLPPFIKGYIGAGQVLPIWRGGGIDQGLFRDFASFLAQGEWCHIFPEGGVWQCKELGGRGRDFRGVVSDSDTNKKNGTSSRVDRSGKNAADASKLRWGVGKLIAHAPIRPRVIPFAHVGMENILPSNPVTGKTELKRRIFGGEPLKVHVRFGEEIHFDDLIEEHEKTHGALWKYDGADSAKNATVHKWMSSDSDKELYHKITLRIEERMESLTEKVVCRET